MSLKAAIQAAAGAAFAAVDDIPQSAVLRRRGQGSYSASSGEKTEFVETDTCTVIVVEYSKKELQDGSIRVTDRKGTILASTLTTMEPKTRDDLIIDGVTWAIIDSKKDPADATFMCQLRTAHDGK